MEGPTPVSSLLHSCTLVMAGIFSLYNLEVKLSTGHLVTALLSLGCVALIARVESDFKRLVASSTVIMVGFM